MVFDKLKNIQGVRPIMPRGAMYIMVGIEPSQFRDIKNDVDFAQKLLKEQSVFCLPASVRNKGEAEEWEAGAVALEIFTTYALAFSPVV